MERKREGAANSAKGAPEERQTKPLVRCQRSKAEREFAVVDGLAVALCTNGRASNWRQSAGGARSLAFVS